MRLSKEQRAVVDSTAANILVIAGPGSGKTATMVERITHLVNTGTRAAGIVCITFTNAGAKELHSRLPATMEPLGYVGTLHGFALRELQRHGDVLGYGSRITVLDEEQSAEMLASTAKSTGYKGTKKKLEATLDGWHQSPGTRQLRGPADITVASFFRELRTASAVTYDAILWDFLELLKREGGLIYNARAAVWDYRRTEHQSMVAPVWDHLIVDEYQDSGPVDALIYDALPVAHRCRVGDPDQAIYGFRGGDVRQIVELAGNLAVETHTLEGNFRCKPAICHAANTLIENNRQRLPKCTRSVDRRDTEDESTLKQAAGLVRKLPGFEMDDAERLHVLWEIQKELMAGVPAREIAVLSRYNATATAFAEAAEAMGIPVRKKSQERPPGDWAQARAAIELLNAPKSTLAARQWLRVRWGAETAAAMEHTADKAQEPLWRQILQLGMMDVTPETLPTALARMGIERASIERVEAVIAETPEPTLNAIAFSLTRDLDHRDEMGDGVTFTTLHSAKGREWELVWLVGMEDEITPGRRGEPEEERRLVFVGVTRAKHGLTLTHALKRRQTWGDKRHAPSTPSRFLAEIQP